MKLFKEEDLPTGQEIFTNLKRLRNSNESDVETLRDWIFEKTEVLKSIIAQFIEANEFTEDPEVYQDRLLRYHYLNGGLIGFSEGLYERAVYLPYKQMTDSSLTIAKSTEGTVIKKLTAGDRELYAKGEASDLKGLKRDLEEMQRNLWERIQLARNAKRY